MIKIHNKILSTFAFVLLSTSAIAQNTAVTTPAQSPVANPVPQNQSANISARSEGDAVSVTGTVESASGNTFVMNYGSGKINVDMGGWDWYSNEAEKLTAGEKVTVTGTIDDGFFKGREIKAENVYIHDRYSYYYSTGQGDANYLLYGTPPEGSAVSVTGIVNTIEGKEFTLNTGKNVIRVDTAKMTYDPLDDEGFQKIKVGDRLRVYGVLSDDLFDTREVDATTVVNLYERPRS